MDDLSGINWAPSKPQGQSAQGNYYPSLRPTPPISGRSTPLNIVNNGTKAAAGGSGSKPSTPGNDSFANLVSFSGPQPSKNVSLQEQQRAIQEKKLKEETERRQQFDQHFAKPVNNPLSGNAAGTSTLNSIPTPSQFPLSPHRPSPFDKPQQPALSSSSSSSPNVVRPKTEEKEEEILAAFNATAPVDASSHMPPVSDQNSGNFTIVNGNQHIDESLADDDDPFGLGMAAPASQKPKIPQAAVDDDDVLGDLSKPVSDFPKPKLEAQKGRSVAPSAKNDPQDQALAELIDMGFPQDRARRALDSTDSGADVQAAVGWLLNQAHEESRKDKQRSSQNRRDSLNSSNSRRQAGRRKSSGGSNKAPTWMKESGKSSASISRHDSRSPAKGEKDPAQMAQDFGNNLFKTANSLWKTGTKKLNQAVADFSTEADPNQPKWMREANGSASTQAQPSSQQSRQAQNHDRRPQHQSGPKRDPPGGTNVTDEALLLEAGTSRPQKKVPSRTGLESRNAYPIERKESTSPAAFSQPFATRTSQSSRDPRAKLSRQAVEEEAAQAYISPARRRKAAAKPQSEEPDLLSVGGPPAKPTPASNAIPSKPRPVASPPMAARPPPNRNIPSVSPTSIAQSHLHRQTGSEAFKRGDYAAATTSYSTALSHLPPSHPLTLPLLTNRALSHSKTGDPKATLVDTKATLDLIGPSRGIGETVDFGAEEGKKDMNTYWGKAMQRQAEAHEALERYADAAAAWRACVEAGVGGAASITGRNRCENALRPKPRPAASSTSNVASTTRKVPARPKPSALSDLGPPAAQSAEAVTRLRAANLAAEQADDEKFRLADIVEARVKAWRNGKEGNLRALLSSLENVLWAEAGWKKVGMGEVIQPGRVKVVYMKGIAKVHPDKLPTSATTEQKMISAAVFATLNEAWEKFKTENGL